ncbi:hypothetical protein [Microcoleus sp. CAWBG58]|uniref:hypothetical protein n=1 Tax=Microcoleus sp. CAWBG58 TaxID=2841651 RepID=UPI0025E87D46|nr:hypothetical protein [Microcoleus sp. CAWBG58]
MGVNYQGASTNLVSGNTTPFSGEFGKLARIYGCTCDRQKNPAKIDRELINQGASTNPVSWEFISNPESCIKFFNRAIASGYAKSEFRRREGQSYFGWSDRGNVSATIEFGAGYYQEE